MTRPKALTPARFTRGSTRRLATTALSGLLRPGRERRLRVMTGITLRENTRMIDLSRSLGFSTRADADEPELVRMTLTL